MRRRNGEEVEARLRQCSLYDPALDLAVETAAGEVAGYALFWFDPVTKVGLVEPMRVEDAYQRRGLARALLTTGLDRLAERGARRLKVGYATDVARRLYVGAGFDVISTDRLYSRNWRKRSKSARIRLAGGRNWADSDLMAAITALPSSPRMDIRFHDRVQVPDGRTGEIVGFYRTKTEMALVRLADGESCKFVLSELELVARD